MQSVSHSPPRAPPIQYTAPLGTRWSKEKAAAGGASAFDLPTDPKCIGPWILGECVGKGASGRVKIAKHRRTGQLAAVKILPIAPLVNSRASLATQQAKSDKQRLGIDREITMMKLMNHPNIMRIYDVYEGDKELFLVLEYVEGGELFDFLVNRGRLPPYEALIYFRQILYGLNYAHTFSIIHRDLKPENILIASLSPPQIKIADWGMAAFAPPSLQLETSCGSPHYASPEIVNGEKYQGNATDIWSCGVILYALLTGRLPFDDKNVRTLLSKVKSGKYEMPNWIDPLAKDLLSKMLIVDVNQRITIPEILSHPWLVINATIPFASTQGATFTLLAPPLPPSPSILARPIASPDLIDSELFSSLRIIWGRHADAHGESIKRDLCAPAGHGVHAKAFYFLLGKYREYSYRSRSNDIDCDSQRTLASSTIDLGTLKFNLGWELDQSGANSLRKYEVPKNRRVFSTPQGPSSSLVSPTVPPHASTNLPPRVTPRKRTLTDGSLPMKELSESPAGLRIPPRSSQAEAWRTRIQTQQGSSSASGASNTPRPKSSVAPGRGGPRPFPPRRGYTSSVVPAPPPEGSGQRNASDPLGSIGFSQHLHQLQARTASASLTASPQRRKSSVPVGPPSPFMDADKRAIFAISSSPGATTSAGIGIGIDPALSQARHPFSPITIPDNSSVILGSGEINLPLLTAPKIENPQLQRTMDDITQKVNELVQAVTQGPVGLGETETRKPAHTYAKIDEGKENINQSSGLDDESWSHVSAEVDRSGGLGLGVLRDVGNDTGYVTSPVKPKKEKEKKARPPPLELPSLNHSLNHRRVALGILGSPIALSSPVHPPPPTSANRILASPVVGEFKGWFSNLFNWKHSSAHGGVLYSSDDLHRTRANVARLLDSLGISLSATTSVGEISATPSHDQISETLFCRLEQPRTDPATGIALKNVRFRVEFRASTPSLSAEPQTGMLSPTIEENAYYLSAPSPNSATSQLVTPNPASSSASASASRSRASVLLGRSSHGIPFIQTPGPHSGTTTTTLPSPGLTTTRWDSHLPPGCLSVIALVHEKGSMSTFRAVWRRLKEEYGDFGAAAGAGAGVAGGYPCFSPAIPPTPCAESR